MAVASAVCWSRVSACKTAEPFDIPLAMWTRGCPWEHEWGPDHPPGMGHLG